MGKSTYLGSFMFEGYGKTRYNETKVLSVYGHVFFFHVGTFLIYFDISGSDSKAEVVGKSCENSTVFSSLPMAIKWLRDSVSQQNRSIRLQVIVPFVLV